ncbi:protein disulfide-isomerase A4-like [Stegodyphus dumicola]|uniref:protein disulfide-isomerase A4-like n=1 Tax=Stegodyphus dumicola TaxID=202533 RepID=UPI0015AA724F|nr:protein disulfide-isomerase A4-like [Stegodyphus dumicola]
MTRQVSLLILIYAVIVSKNCLCQDDIFDEDIPVVEGDGGVITTAVEDDVLVLTRENFDIQIASKDIILVEFYAPWCGHCKALAPEYSKAAKILKNEDPPIHLAKVDATIETDLAARYDVTSYPTLYIFKKGEKVLYDGPRSALGIVEYMKERSDPNWKPPPEAVITLTKENFTEMIEKAEIILVEFFAPWCGHCKRLAPEYERAAKVLKDLPTPIPLAKIDGTAEKEIADKYEARGWPALMIFRKGQKYPYEGPREETGIISYMKEQAKPPSQEITSPKVLEKSLGKIDASVVGFFLSDSDPLYLSYIEAANTLRGKFSFFHTFSQNVMKQFGVKDSRIILYQPEIFSSKYEPPKHEFNKVGALSSDIVTFIKEHHLPLVGERNQRSRWKYDDKYPLVVVYYDVDFSFDHRIQTQLVRKEVTKVAKDYKGKITFAISDEEEFEDELIQLGLDDSGEDVNVGFFESRKVRYKMEPTEDFSAEELRTFVENVLAGNVSKHVKSQPVPKDNKGPVLVVVGSTFEELVTKSTKDVLIEFYAPWCGHCKKLEPEYKKLGKAFASNDKVVIAKIDATANDYPEEFKVDGFPTIYYIPAADKKNLITYSGERTLKDLSDFVNKQISKEAKDEL